MHSCTRFNSGPSALISRRDSGGIAVYFKTYLSNLIQLVKINTSGILWFKLITRERDLFIGVCYIPPEGSSVYRCTNSPLFQLDFFDILDVDIQTYSTLGDIYLCGDLNSRTGVCPDYVDDINLSRFIDVPVTDNFDIPVRKSDDKIVNAYGHRLLSLCKENSLHITNGRLEPGRCTYHCVGRGHQGSSVVDYLITNFKHFNQIVDMSVLDLTELSDHCPIQYSFLCKKSTNVETEESSYIKLNWDKEGRQRLLDCLEQKREVFENIIKSIEDNSENLNADITNFSDIINECSTVTFGKVVNRRRKSNKQYSNKWFTNECKTAKRQFLEDKRNLKFNNSDENKLKFLESIRHFVKMKRKAKKNYNTQEKRNLSYMSKFSPKTFWNKVNQFRNGKYSEKQNIDLSEFVSYYKSLFNEDVNGQTMNCQNFDFSSLSKTESNVEILDRSITNEEVMKTIFRLLGTRPLAMTK